MALVPFSMAAVSAVEPPGPTRATSGEGSSASSAAASSPALAAAHTGEAAIAFFSSTSARASFPRLIAWIFAAASSCSSSSFDFRESCIVAMVGVAAAG